MAQIICRHASDDFYALLTAQGMENAGASVFSIVCTGKQNSLAYVVFAKYESPLTYGLIDKSIEIALEAPND